MRQFTTESLAIFDTLPFLANLPPWAETLASLALLAFIAWVANFIVKHVLLRIVTRWLPHQGVTPLPAVARLANVVPALIVANGIVTVPHLPTALVPLVSNVAAASIIRSDEHTSELTSLMRLSYAVFCFQKTQKQTRITSS